MSNVSKDKVHHEGPLGADILILGEAPNKDEDVVHRPFVGRSGEYLNFLLEMAGISRDACRVANVCNYHPAQNRWKLLEGSWQLNESERELRDYLTRYPPKLIIPLGGNALQFLMGFAQIKGRHGSVYQHGTSWVVPTYHPAAAIKDGVLGLMIKNDFSRAVEVLNNGWQYPTYNYIIDPSREQFFDEILPKIREAEHVSADIETLRKSVHIRCSGFAWSGTDGVCLRNNVPHASELIDGVFREMVEAGFAAAKSVDFHNSSFDVEVFRIHSIEAPVHYDTMIAQKIIEPEIPVGLASCTRLYTRQNYYKDDGKDSSGKTAFETLAEYNVKDVCCAFQTRQAQSKIFAKHLRKKKYYDDKFKYHVKVGLNQLQRNGMLRDEDRVAEMTSITEERLEHAFEAIHILADIDDRVYNLRSSAQVQDLLYTRLGLPIRRSYEGEITVDEDAIVSLIYYAKGELDSKVKDETKKPWRVRLQVLKLLLKVREYEKLLSSYFKAKARPDGRFRYMYLTTGAETMRASAQSYVDETGFSPQTMPRGEV